MFSNIIRALLAASSGSASFPSITCIVLKLDISQKKRSCWESAKACNNKVP